MLTENLNKQEAQRQATDVALSVIGDSDGATIVDILAVVDTDLIQYPALEAWLCDYQDRARAAGLKALLKESTVSSPSGIIVRRFHCTKKTIQTSAGKKKQLNL